MRTALGLVVTHDAKRRVAQPERPSRYYNPMRVVLALLAITACHGDATPPQTLHDAVAILCGAQQPPVEAHSFQRWLDRVISNPDAREFLAANARPWDIAAHIRQLAEQQAIDKCTPLDGLTGIRAANGVNVPDLPDERGTLDGSKGRIIAIGPAQLEIQGAGRFDPADRNGIMYALMKLPPAGLTFVAVDRSTTMKAATPILELLGGAVSVEVLATSGSQPRAVWLQFRQMPDYDGKPTTTAVLKLGTDQLTMDDTPIALDRVREALAKNPADRVVVVPEPDVTVQRLVETVAAAGGTAFLGESTLPHVVRYPRGQ